MGILKYIERARRMDDLIRRKATGNTEEFANKLGISRSVLMDHLAELRDLGAPIVFDEGRCCYRYDNEFTLFSREIKRLKGIKGGFAGSFGSFFPVRYYRTLTL